LRQYVFTNEAKTGYKEVTRWRAASLDGTQAELLFTPFYASGYLAFTTTNWPDDLISFALSSSSDLQIIAPRTTEVRLAFAP